MFRKKILLLVGILVFNLLLLQADEPFSKRASQKPILVQDGAKKRWCEICGMSLKMFYKTSHAFNQEQFCSIRCLIVYMKEHKINLDEVKVVDAKTEKLIPAQNAFYVVGSKVKGTMSKVSKLAFASKEDAESFVKSYGGEIVTFQKALEMAEGSLKSDMAMLMKKKEKKIYPMGKKLFEGKCKQDIDLKPYKQINELKSSIMKDKLCDGIKGKQLQMVALYLWDVKNRVVIKIEESDKCPVCGMFVYKYPKWASEIRYKDGHKHLFDGVKDMMKFYFDRTKYGKFETSTKENIDKILVTDYYTQKAIDGTKAFYVVGSDVLGPMGNELIPFKNEQDAQTFKDDHKGKRVIKFDDITRKDIESL